MRKMYTPPYLKSWKIEDVLQTSSELNDNVNGNFGSGDWGGDDEDDWFQITGEENFTF